MAAQAKIKFPGVRKNLGGDDYIIPPLSLNALSVMQERLENYGDGNTDKESIKTVIEALHSSLVRNYPDITPQQVGDLVDVGNMDEIMKIVMDTSGLLRKQQEAEAMAAPGEPLIGTSSTST